MVLPHLRREVLFWLRQDSFSRNKLVCLTIAFCVLLITLTTSSHIQEIRDQQVVTEQARKSSRHAGRPEQRVSSAKVEIKRSQPTLPEIDKLFNKYELDKAYF